MRKIERSVGTVPVGFRLYTQGDSTVSPYGNTISNLNHLKSSHLTNQSIIVLDHHTDTHLDRADSADPCPQSCPCWSLGINIVDSLLVHL